ncbi:MAG: sugar ABC transporter substrate-binding protein, partial [Cohaesibacteraceae bacterium]
MSLTETSLGSNPAIQAATSDTLSMLSFLDDFGDELEGSMDLVAPNPYLRMELHLLRGHFEAKTVTASSLVGASRVPYATATRRLKEMIEAGLIDQRPRTRSGRSVSLHPSQKLLSRWVQLSGRIRRLAEAHFGNPSPDRHSDDYFYGGSYMAAQTGPPLQVLPEPLKLTGGLRVLAHGDPTFMVMDNLKRQFEQVIGTQIHERAFSIDRLREEAIRN